jgi:response regulator NasT
MKILLIEDPSTASSIVYNTLVSEGYDAPVKVNSHDDIFRKASDASADLIVVNVEEPDNKMLKQLKTINEIYPVPVVIFSMKGESDVIQSAVQAGVSAFIIDGLSEKRIKPVLNVALARFNNYEKLRDELAKTKETLANRKTIEKAKGLIMQQRHCTEDEAYNLLRKLAMDRNQKLSEVANSLIELSSLLIHDKTLNDLMPT